MRQNDDWVLARSSTKLILENENGQYSIEIPAVELDLDGLIENLIGPVLKAAGYHCQLVDDALQL
jgi:hypothetical protein